MINYKDDDTFLGRWLSGNLTDKELKEFQKSDDFELLSKIAQKSTEFKSPVFNMNNVKLEIQKSIYNKKPKVLSLYYKIGIAASIALLCTIAGISYFSSLKTTITTHIGELRTVTLPDGSVAELNGKSLLTYKKKDWENNKRTLFLEGEGFFKVKKGSTFTVMSNEGRVSVVGTQFNVKTLPDFYAVECYEGKVQVKKDTTTLLLSSGKGFYYKYGNQHNLSVEHTYPNWKSKNYTYDKIPLSVVFRDLQNIYHITNLKPTTTDLALEFTGQLVTDDLYKALNIICKPMHLTYTLSKDNIIITPL
ncbi:FecR family protein [Aquimarina sp. ERC-38]|uniref:FecR family protein n=1 Tax=Aquimarina sp. ERC-38 TaxID=2949996 RepID=UPI00224532A3|nr:FecR family protein [Aquimarina sp. ERC-38]UZO80551.1 FecR family protein [Aquimarina sp. ERC-38]